MIYDVTGKVISSGDSADVQAELYLGTMVRAANAADGIQASTIRICMKNSLALPYGDKTDLTVNISEGYKITIRVGASPYNLSSNLYYFSNGDKITLPSGANFYRVSVAKSDDTADISLDEWDNINLHIYYTPHEKAFVNEDSAANADFLYAPPTGKTNMFSRTLPTFLHTSDVHADYVRVKRFAEYAKALGVSMACITGDITGYNVYPDSNHFEWFHEIVKDSGIQWGVCVGNHDSHVGSGGSAYTMADDDVYDIFFDPIAEELGNETGEVWYVKDLDADKIRVISLDLYQYGGVWTKTFFTQDQLTWLCTTLAATPEDYGVVILMHAQQRSVVKDDSYAKFYQTLRKGESAEYYNAVDNDGDPIGDIVNAFIGKTTISQTYTQNSGADTLTVSADFSGVASGVEFICYMTGHFHQDTVGYLTRPAGDPKQLVLNVTCGCSVYGGSSYKYLADVSDLPRNQQDSTQDAFNVYGIDRQRKCVRIARVGSSCTFNMDFRDSLAIPYDDAGSGNGGPVTSVNNQTGAVSLGAADVGALPASGGTMSGAIAMGSNKITGLANGTADNDAVNLSQMADAISTNTAYFRGNFATKAALLAVAWQTSNPAGANYVTNNDFAIVQDDETQNDECWRYVYVSGTGWSAQYKVNESPLTQAQLDALNSGATASNISAISGKITAPSSASDGQFLTYDGISGAWVATTVPSASGVSF